MSLTSIEHYAVEPGSVSIPDRGLGAFLCGFTEERKPFNWTNIWFNLLPGAGQILFIGHVIRHCWVKNHPDRVLLYQNGFIKQSLDNKGKVKQESIINYYDIKGVLYAKTRQYQSIYGIKAYNGTTVALSVLDKSNIRRKILWGSYRNKNDVDGKYNFIGYACNAISDCWLKFAINKFNEELCSRGYGSFTSPTGEITVGRDFIGVNNTVISSGFKYSFDNGYLYLYPNAAEGSHFAQKSKPVAINIAGMYNKEVFLLAIGQLHGIK